MSVTLPHYVHAWVPAVDVAAAPFTLLVLHGTGGNESSLVNLARTVAPAANVLSPRGNVSEGGMPRFFRRFAEGVFDVEDIKRRSGELAEFVAAAAGAYRFDTTRVLALGYSNGANIAAAMMLLRPEVLAGGVLLRPMVPLIPEVSPTLGGKSILIAAGRGDPISGDDQPRELGAIFQQAGAEVRLEWLPGGHSLSQLDVNLAHDFLTRGS